MNILEVNATEKVKSAIKKVAKNNDLDYEIVYFIFSFSWNKDNGYRGRIKAGDLEIDDEYTRRKKIVCDKLNLQDSVLDKNYLIEKVYDSLSKTDTKTLWRNFLYGSVNGHNGYVSEYATYYYLTNATKENLETLYWCGKNLTVERELSSIYLKLFNGGIGAHNSLEYSYTDLTVQLPYTTKTFDTEDWTENFIKDIIGEKLTLTGLIKTLRQYCKGDKYFLQSILEALSYSGVLKVPEIDVKNIFLPDYRETKSKHFYSNEWAYPLRLWNE
jgi:hypothetical protein